MLFAVRTTQRVALANYDRPRNQPVEASY